MEMGGLTAAFVAPVHALPVDAFRVLVGLVSFCYFARTLLEARDFSACDGVLDHALSHRLFPPTRMSAFQCGLPASVCRAAFVLACGASLALMLGYEVRVAAVFLFLIAVSTYRWNFLVMYVDDGIMHLVLFWMMLLPVGRTLTLDGWLRDGPAALQSWASVTVPGGVVRGFLANLSLAYFVAGAYKWTSPMWRDGSALHAILLMPIGRMSSFWRPGHRVPLRLASLGALAVEPLFPLVFLMPSGTVAKWLAVMIVVSFHLGIVATLRIPFANAAMLGVVPIALHDEMMHGLGVRPMHLAPAATPSLGGAELLGLFVVACLAGMVLLEVRSNGISRPPLWKTNVSRLRRDPMCATLWVLGIAQSYRLFDWVDRRNFHVRYRLTERRPGAPARELDPESLFPRTIRHLILQSYLHGSIWLQIHEERLVELRRAILHRYAARYALRHPDTGIIEVTAVVQRITADNLELTRGVPRVLMRFACSAGEASVEYVSLDPQPPTEAPAWHAIEHDAYRGVSAGV